MRIHVCEMNKPQLQEKYWMLSLKFQAASHIFRAYAADREWIAVNGQNLLTGERAENRVGRMQEKCEDFALRCRQWGDDSNEPLLTYQNQLCFFSRQYEMIVAIGHHDQIYIMPIDEYFY